MSLPEDMNLAWHDPELQRAAEALIGDDPAPARDLLAATSDPDKRELYATVLGQAGRRRLKTLRALAEDGADRHTTLLLGAALSYAAWAARGAASMAATSDEQVHGMFTYAQQSRETLGRAAALSPGDPVPLVVLLSVVKAAAQDSREPHRLYANAASLAPNSFMANHQRLSMLCRKWYGSTDEMLTFMRQQIASLPDGHPLLSLAPQAHIEVWVEGWMRGNIFMRLYRRFSYRPLKRRSARAEVDRASARLLSGADAYAEHPWMMLAHQMFGAYYTKAGKKAKARAHLERGGERAGTWAWDYFGTPQAQLRQARGAAGL